MTQVNMPGDRFALRDRFQRDGFAVVENLVPQQQVQQLQHRLMAIATGRVATFPSELIEYEPTAGQNRVGAVRKINQCAENDDVFLEFAASPAVLDIVEALIGPDVKLYGSQCFMKPPGGIEKPYHQDSAYFCIDPPELVTCWAALDDATVENGCLFVIPGSHRGPILDHDEPWQVGDRLDMQVRRDQFDASREVAVELPAGSVSFHHSRLLHRSGPNLTERSRRGLAVHYMSAKSRWTDPAKAGPDCILLRGREYEDCV